LVRLGGVHEERQRRQRPLVHPFGRLGQGDALALQLPGNQQVRRRCFLAGGA